MKKLILIISLFFLYSCNSDIVNYSCTKGTIQILNKEKYPCSRGGGYCSFVFYLYDGKEAYNCYTDQITYELYNTGDTLPTLVITKEIKIK
jgi:hypothetical protein